MKPAASSLIIALFLMAACSPAAAPVETAFPPLETPQPIGTPSASETPLPSATSTPSSTPSPTAAPAFDTTRYGTTVTDVTYCTMDGLTQMMDIYYPASGGPWPVLLYVHGGSWNQGDKAEGSGWSGMTALGYLVVSVNYRLASYPYKFPVMIEDIQCAVRHLRAHSADYNLDPDRIGAAGASAGGHLVALLGTADESAGWKSGEYLEQSSRVQAVITLAGPTDFTLDFPDTLNTSIFVAFGDSGGKSSPTMIAASPVTYVTSDDPPFLIIHGDQDLIVPVEQAYALQARLQAAGVSSTLVIVEGGFHNMNGLYGETKPTRQEIDAMIVEFLEQNLKDTQ